MFGTVQLHPQKGWVGVKMSRSSFLVLSVTKQIPNNVYKTLIRIVIVRVTNYIKLLISYLLGLPMVRDLHFILYQIQFTK